MRWLMLPVSALAHAVLMTVTFRFSLSDFHL